MILFISRKSERVFFFLQKKVSYYSAYGYERFIHTELNIERNRKDKIKNKKRGKKKE